MTPADRAIYDRMSPRQQEAIDALSEGLRAAALAIWQKAEARPIRRHASTRMQPDRTTVDPMADETERRFP